jgi:hypothetical protein
MTRTFCEKCDVGLCMLKCLKNGIRVWTCIIRHRVAMTVMVRCTARTENICRVNNCCILLCMYHHTLQKSKATGKYIKNSQYCHKNVMQNNFWIYCKVSRVRFRANTQNFVYGCRILFSLNSFYLIILCFIDQKIYLICGRMQFQDLNAKKSGQQRSTGI